MNIILVNDQCSIDDFHNSPAFIYRNNREWVPMLREILENMFSSETNSALTGGNVRRWIVRDENITIGRIAAFHLPDYAKNYEQLTGCIGFFESVENKEVAFLLFDAARQWLKGIGMEAMDGPVNAGVNFFNWGLLSNGFRQQTFGMPYHHAYYRNFFELYGFKTYYEQYSYRMDIINPDLPERFWKIAEWIGKKPGYSYEHFTFKNLNKYINDFITIYDQAWQNHDNYKAIPAGEIKSMLYESRIFLDEEFIWFVYHNNQPIAFFMMIPDLNQVVKKLKNNRLTKMNILRILFYKKIKTITRCRVVVMGVIPKFQRLGLESGLFYQLRQVVLRKPWYKEVEMSWVGDFNPKMIALFDSIGARHEITHITFRYLFDQTREFNRAPIINN